MGIAAMDEYDPGVTNFPPGFIDNLGTRNVNTASF
jgi:hypothetical protein